VSSHRVRRILPPVYDQRGRWGRSMEHEAARCSDLRTRLEWKRTKATAESNEKRSTAGRDRSRYGCMSSLRQAHAQRSRGRWRERSGRVVSICRPEKWDGRVSEPFREGGKRKLRGNEEVGQRVWSSSGGLVVVEKRSIAPDKQGLDGYGRCYFPGALLPILQGRRAVASCQWGFPPNAKAATWPQRQKLIICPGSCTCLVV
jgi:hypothetical protein